MTTKKPAMPRTEKARQKAVDECCAAIVSALRLLPSDYRVSQVVEVFKAQAQEYHGAILGHAFWELDDHPRWYSDYLVWHPKLRSARNHPEAGPAIFALFA